MAQSSEDKKKPAYFQLKTAQNVRTTLARLFRLRYNEVIDSAKCRDLVYIARGMLEHDKHLVEVENGKRLDAIERQLCGDKGETIIDSAQIDNPYAQSLRKQVDELVRMNDQLTGEIMSLKRERAYLQSGGTVWTGEGEGDGLTEVTDA
jgi:hypothetical protein